MEINMYFLWNLHGSTSVFEQIYGLNDSDRREKNTWQPTTPDEKEKQAAQFLFLVLLPKNCKR